MQFGKYDITVFLVSTTIVVLLLATLIITLIYLYQKKQISNTQKLEGLRLDHEKNLLGTKLEIQEDTFQHISREIHDNINLSLTLAKLHLNTFDWANKEKANMQLSSSIEILGHVITNLSDISRGLNSDIIINQGLIKAIENEIKRIRFTGAFTLFYNTTGNPVFMDTKKELIVFRIIQEAFSNIIKHAQAKQASLVLHFASDYLYISISDNGKGFINADDQNYKQHGKAGLSNMQTRTKMIGGSMIIKSKVTVGTSLMFNIPVQ
ncbi:MAG: ATP-binding protein [Chitinophagaceae bacterium]